MHLMLRKQSKKTSKMGSPKLRSSAGEARCFVPWGLQIAEAYLNKDDLLEGTILAAVRCLQDCYASLSRATFEQDKLKQSCRQFCILYASISKHYADSEQKLWVFSNPSFIFPKNSVNLEVAIPACIGLTGMKISVAPLLILQEDEVEQTPFFLWPQMFW